MISKNTHIKITCDDAHSQEILAVLEEKVPNLDYIKFGSSFCYCRNNGEFGMLRDIYLNANDLNFKNKSELFETVKSAIFKSISYKKELNPVKEIKLIDTDIMYELVQVDPEFGHDIKIIKRDSSVSNLFSSVFDIINITCKEPASHIIRACLLDCSRGDYFNPLLEKNSFFEDVLFSTTSFQKHPFLFAPINSNE